MLNSMVDSLKYLIFIKKVLLDNLFLSILLMIQASTVPTVLFGQFWDDLPCLLTSDNKPIGVLYRTKYESDMNTEQHILI